jgi:hypothetical protein
MGLRVPLLYAVQDPFDRHQHPELLLRLVQIREILRQEVSASWPDSCIPNAENYQTSKNHRR